MYSTFNIDTSSSIGKKGSQFVEEETRRGKGTGSDERG
jgi:hypothetical protein